MHFNIADSDLVMCAFLFFFLVFLFRYKVRVVLLTWPFVYFLWFTFTLADMKCLWSDVALFLKYSSLFPINPASEAHKRTDTHMCALIRARTHMHARTRAGTHTLALTHRNTDRQTDRRTYKHARVNTHKCAHARQKRIIIPVCKRTFDNQKRGTLSSKWF